jgi:hypothetical protein
MEDNAGKVHQRIKLLIHINGTVTLEDQINSYARLFTRISSALLKFCLLFPFAFPKLVSTRFNFRRLHLASVM